MAKDFRALRVHRVEKTTEARIETLSLDELNPDVAKDNSVVIRTAWSGINYKDALAVTGKGRILRRYPLVAGIDGAGVVESSGSAQFKPGDEVLITGCNLSETLDGGYSEVLRLPAEVVVPLPAGLSLQEAMLLGTAGFTAALAVRRMQENHQTPDMGPIAVTGATGGVGSVAIQILSQLGYAVTAITGKPDSSAGYLKSLGASEVLDRRNIEMGKAPLESARWGGAIDNVGGELLGWLIRTVKPWGNIGSVGLAASHELHGTVMPFILRGVSLLGIHSVECPMPWRRAIWEKLAGDWKPAALTSMTHSTIGLDELPAACNELLAGSVQGRFLVRLNG